MKTMKSKIMDFVEANGGIAHRSEIIRFILESKGIQYNSKKHRGYYGNHFRISKYRWVPYLASYKLCACTFKELGYLMKSSKAEKRYLTLIKTGLYKVVS